MCVGHINMSFNVFIIVIICMTTQLFCPQVLGDEVRAKKIIFEALEKDLVSIYY
jgi:hypothetical protein